jgi:hypothetical protein
MRGAVAAAAAAAVVAAVGAGLFVLGRPDDERARRLDERRVEDLRGLARAVDLYWTRHSALPASVAALTSEPGLEAQATDPDTGIAYEFTTIGSGRYELCATFAAASPPVSAGRDEGAFWSHGSGRQCFAREARRIR